MADYWALSAGNWSNVSNWLTGTSPGQRAGELPGPADIVYANNRIVTVDITTQVNSVRNIANSVSLTNGNFILSDGITLSAFIIGRASPVCVQYYGESPNQATIVGNLCAINLSNFDTYVAENYNTGTLNIIGDVLGGANNSVTGGGPPGSPDSYGTVANRGSGTINVFGNVYNQQLGTINSITNLSDGTINILGNLSGSNNGGSIERGFAVVNFDTGTVNITGDIFNNRGGGVLNSNEGVVNARGNIICYPGTLIGGMVNRQGGIINLQGNIFLSASGIVGIRNAGIGTISMSGNVIVDAGTFNWGIANHGSGFIYLTGSAFAGPLASSVGLTNFSDINIDAGSTGNGTIFVYGSVYGGLGANSHGLTNQDGLVFIYGNAYGGQGTGGNGARNTRFGTINVRTAVGNNWGIGSVIETGPVPGVVNTLILGACYVEELSSASRGTFPVSGPNIYINRRANNQASFVGATSANSTTIQSPSILTLISSLSGFGVFVPLVSNVRFGTVYDLKALTGTLIIPPTQVVVSGTQVDTLTSFGTFFTDLPRAWQTQMSAITAQNSLGVRFKNIITLPETENVWLLDT
jgi:hypothetical protein